MSGLQISRSHASAIIKKLRNWRLLTTYKGGGKGRARGRQLVYALNDEARRILEQNLKEMDFLREAVIQTSKAATEKSPSFPWRKDLQSS